MTDAIALLRAEQARMKLELARAGHMLEGFEHALALLEGKTNRRGPKTERMNSSPPRPAISAVSPSRGGKPAGAGRKSRFSEAQQEELRRLWLDGSTIGAIASRFGVGRRCIEVYRKRLALPPRGKGWQPPASAKTGTASPAPAGYAAVQAADRAARTAGTAAKGPRERPCLRCRKKFLSHGNRVCPACHGSEGLAGAI